MISKAKDYQILIGDALKQLRTLPTESIHCCVTSPPYWGLRNYGKSGQIGMEPTMREYVNRLSVVFREVRRVLRSDGTLWLNLGDTYLHGKGTRKRTGRDQGKQQCSAPALPPYSPADTSKELPPKSLCLIPARVAIALQDDGWILRNDIIWNKSNPLPESVKDRCTKSHEHIFMFSKSPNYYLDAEAIAEPCADSTLDRISQDLENQKGSDRIPGKTNGNMKTVLPRYGGAKYTDNPDVFFRTKSGNTYEPRPFRNKRDVWTIPTAGFRGAHFATFPEKLVEPCILAGCPECGTVLDPFLGSGTTAVVALKHGRKAIGIELNPEYAEIARQRIEENIVQPMLF